MRPADLHRVAVLHYDAGPGVAELARSGRIVAGTSSELLDRLHTGDLSHEEREQLAAAWAFVEWSGPTGARTLRQLDAEARSVAAERERILAEHRAAG